ncbi:MAG TPA: glycosyltransferase family 4 protein [Tepidisphaeraceae bacterium]|jgi:glycosyltransferase involved in cell wall biosynthesis
MHVLILNQTFHPDVAATAQHMWDLARHLDAAGHRVTVVTSRTLYGTSELIDKAVEIYGNITVHRVTQTSFGKRHNLGRMADFLSFYLTAFWKMMTLPAPDVILALTSPPMIATMAVVVRSLRSATTGRRIALVNHVMDLYPDAAVAMGVLKPRSLITRIMAWLTRRTFHSCDALIALGHDMKQRIIDTYGVAADRIHIIQPWADSREIYPTPRDTNPLRKSLGLGDIFIAMYSGNLGKAHDVDTLIAAVRQSRDRADLRWCFTGGGAGMKQLRAAADTEGWPNITFLPYQPREALNDLLNLADVHLLSQLPAFTGIVVPSKLFGIMAAGKPTLMVGPSDAEAARILMESGAGAIVSTGDVHVHSLLSELDRLMSNPSHRSAMGSDARRVLESTFDQSIQCRRLEAVLAGFA